MKIGLIGLGKMGYNLALNLKKNGHEIIGYDVSQTTMESIKTVIKLPKYVSNVKIIGEGAKELTAKIKDVAVTTSGK